MKRVSFIFGILLVLLVLPSVSAATIFFDGFESGGIATWNTSSASGANNWSAVVTDPFAGTVHAQSLPQSTTEPASVLSKLISANGYQNINFSYYRRLIGIDAADEFQVEWFNGTTWTILEQTGGSAADDASYLFRSFLLPAAADNNPNLQIKFECTAGAVSEFCRVDNVNISGDVISTPDTTSPIVNLLAPSNNTFFSVARIYFSANVSDNINVANATLYVWNSTSLIGTNFSSVGLANSIVNLSFTLPRDGTYYWNYFARDNSSNSAWNNTNFSFSFDGTAPSLGILYPQNTTYFTSQSALNYTVSDTNLQACWYSTNLGVTNITLICGNNVTGLASIEGSNIWRVYANDTYGNLNTSSITFNFQTTYPNFTIISPQNTTYVTNNITVNFTSSDLSGISSRWFFNGTANETYTGVVYRTASQGSNTWIFYSNNTLNTLNSTSVTFSVDSIFPQVQFVNPSELNASTITRNNIAIDVTATDTNLVNITIRLYNSTSLVNQTITSSSPNFINVTSLPDGTYYFNATATDSFNNINTTETRVVTITTAVPGINLTYPLNTTYTTIQTALNYTVTDSPQACWYSTDSGVTNTTVTCGVNITGLNSGQGSSTWIVYANNTVGVTNSTSVTFSVDSIAPTVDFVSPTETNASILNRNNILINVTSSDDNFANITIRLYNSTGLVNQTTAMSSINFVNLPGLADGTYYFNATASDNFGNTNSTETRIVTVDTTPPSLIINSPFNITYTNLTILVNLTSNGEGVWFYNGTANETYTGAVYRNFAAGSNTLYAYANDSAGNVNTSFATFSIISNQVPRVSIISPSNNSVIANSSGIFNVTVYDDDLNNMTVRFYLNGVLFDTQYNQTNGTSVLSSWNSLSNGLHTWFVNVSDDYSSYLSDTYSFTINLSASRPNVRIVYPSYVSTYRNNNSLPLNFTVSGQNIGSCWYTLDSGVTNVSISSCANTSLSLSNNGLYNFGIYANETISGLIGNDSSVFYIRKASPTIHLLAPNQINYTNQTNITFLYNPSFENAINNCSLFGNFNNIYRLNHTDNTIDTAVDNNFSMVLYDGNYSWAIGCSSGANYSVTGNRTLFVDATPPNVTFSGITNNQVFQPGEINLNLTINDSSPIKQCTYTLVVVTTNNSITVNLGTNCQSAAINVQSAGEYSISLGAEDAAGNKGNSPSTSFIVSSSESGGSAGNGGSGGGGGSSSGVSGSAKLNFSTPANTYIKRGQNDKLSLSARNTGQRFLNRCSLSLGGELAKYISNSDVVSLSSGEIHDFVLDVSLPSTIDSGQYPLIVIAVCNESSFETSFPIVVIPTEFDYRFVKYERSVDELNIFYTLEEQTKRDQEISISYSLKDSSGIEVTTGSEIVNLASLSKQDRSYVLKLPKDSVGEYTLYTHVSNSKDVLDLQNSVFLSADGVTGFAISDNNLRTLRMFALYLAAGIILIFVVRFIIKHHKNTSGYAHHHIHKIKLHRFK